MATSAPIVGGVAQRMYVSNVCMYVCMVLCKRGEERDRESKQNKGPDGKSQGEWTGGPGVKRYKAHIQSNVVTFQQ